MSESMQRTLLRVRPPRVRITYDVHTNGAIEKRELPFIVGIFADLSGDRDSDADPKVPPEMKDRKIVDIDRDNFNAVLKQSVPRVLLKDVDNVIAGDGTKLVSSVLVFETLADFEPIRVVGKVDVLAEVFKQRKLLRDGQARAEVNDVAAKALEDAVKAVEDSGAIAAALAQSAAALAESAAAVVKAIDTWVPEGAAPTGTDAEVQAAKGERLAARVKGLGETTATLNGAKKTLDEIAAINAEANQHAPKLSEAAATALGEAIAALGETITALAAITPTAEAPTVPDADVAALNAKSTALTDKAAALTNATGWMDAMAVQLKAGFPGKDEAFLNGLVAAFKKHVVPLVVAADGKGKGRGAASSIDLAVSAIDDVLSKQLSAIMHSARFQEMEATWRGLFHLVSRTETSTRLKLRVFNATLQELRDDMSKAVEFDQSKLFKLIYEAEYGTYGGSPYSMLLGGYEIGPGAPDMTFLEKMSEVAADAHAPFLAAASPDMFGLPGYGELARPRDLSKIFEGADLQKWAEFRETEDSRYVSLVMPRVMLRLPYGQKTLPADGFHFEETVSSAAKTPENANFLWGNAAYFLAERITNAFALYSWTAAIRGVEGGGLVEGLPTYTFSSGLDDGIKELFCPTEVAITDRREKELNDLGFIALCHCKGGGRAAFFGGQTTNKAKKYINADANANAALSSRLPYILAASRFAHYIKVNVREKVGGFLTRANVEAYLNTWISQYVLLDDNASQEVKSAFPLREASIVVVDVPGEPGSYKATVFLKPHFQLEELTVSIRLVADLPK